MSTRRSRMDAHPQPAWAAGCPSQIARFSTWSTAPAHLRTPPREAFAREGRGLRRGVHRAIVALSFALSLHGFEGPAEAAGPAAKTAAPAAKTAAPDAEKRVQASNFFDAGAEAYKAGKYQVAAEAFEKAHGLLPSPSLLFSAAQAYRRQYLSEPSPDALKKAIGLYREYLKSDPKANRREDAMEALGTLVPLERIAVPVPGGESKEGSPPSEAAEKKARLLVTAADEGAEVSLDGGPYSAAPLVAQVDPGPHEARVRAAGYDEQEVSLQAVAGELVPQHVSLKPRPAKLDLRGTAGAKVSIDGQPRATLPLSSPLLVEPGAHFVAVTLSGREPFTEQVTLERDQSRTMDVALPLTRQRIFAWSSLTTGGAGLVATGVLAGSAFTRQSEALSLSDRPASSPLTPLERDTYNKAVHERNDFGQAAAVAGGVSALFLITGAALFAFDNPEAPAPTDSAPSKPPKGPATTFEVGLGTIGVRGTF